MTTTRNSNTKKSTSSTAKPVRAAAKAKPKTSTKHAIDDNKKKGTKTNRIPPEEGPWYQIFTKGDDAYDKYMATEWGFEKRGNVALFEKMSLEGAQAGLSWRTILRKREAYRRVFSHFDIDTVAAMTPDNVQEILEEQDDDPSNLVVRHRNKIESVIDNAKCIQKLLQEHSDDPNYFDTFLWSFVQNKPMVARGWDGGLSSIRSQSPESLAMSKALKKLGFRFVGPTTMYAMMQSVGMVLDHPEGSPEQMAAFERLQRRTGGFQEYQVVASSSK